MNPALTLYSLLAFLVAISGGETRAGGYGEAVVAGVGVGKIRLGQSSVEVLKLLPFRAGQDQDTTHSGSCDFREIHLLDPKDPSQGLFIYLHRDKVYQVSVYGKQYRTPEGIGDGSSPASVRKFYPRSNAITVEGVVVESDGPRAPIYWVSEPSGIAFGFYYDAKRKRRAVGSIAVFSPNSTFEPEGCVAAPRNLRLLPKFSLEP